MGMPRTVTVVSVVVEVGESMGLCALVDEETPGEVDAFDLPKPAFGLCVCAAGEQVGVDLVEPPDHPGVDVQHWAADARVFVFAGSRVGAAALAELDLAFVEALVELGPFLVGDGPVIAGRAARRLARWAWQWRMTSSWNTVT